MVYTLADLAIIAAEKKCSLGEAALTIQCEEENASKEKLLAKMEKAFSTMKDSIKAGLNPSLRSMSGRVGGQSSSLLEKSATFPFMGRFFTHASAYALAVAENNAAMGKIVAAPTAGACGILPGILVSAQEEGDFSNETIVESLFTAAAVGKVIAEKATISGAQGGCQAESGSAAAMAAAALTQLYGGTPSMVLSAVSFVFMNMLGL
ncbi:MAG: L-serine ammonia-lyase, iron-sulfur-dependent, subunit alpha, partial [Clostridiales bacterium]|nr:L-serine ammonia-lyase, iron-sulfur-dependent, subunit alpha [Clostridiales bacterium]